jgi:hypothetical protein
MFRKITLLAISAMALIVALGTDNTASQAFAKGSMGKGGRNGMSRFHRGFDRNFRHFNRYGWNYGYGYGYVQPIVEVPVVAPACPTCEVAPACPAPVVAPAPVCPTCEPAVTVVTPEVVAPSYYSSWGYDKYNRFHHRPERFHPLNRGGNRGGRK